MQYVLINIFLLFWTCLGLELSGQNVCKRKATTEINGTIKVLEIFINECCPDYYQLDGECRECPPGTFGRYCESKCIGDTYGPKCANRCHCSQAQRCDRGLGCVCAAGYEGTTCLSMCPTGYYGVNCLNECLCANGASCEPMTGLCVCPPGWIGQYCTNRCDSGMYGTNCSANCGCSVDVTCDPVTGKCIDGTLEENSTKLSKDDNKGQSSLTVYILMAATVTGLVILVTVVIKVKEVVYRSINLSRKVTNQIQVQEITTVSGDYRQQPETAVTNLHYTADQLNVEAVSEDIYCEIEEL